MLVPLACSAKTPPVPSMIYECIRRSSDKPKFIGNFYKGSAIIILFLLGLSRFWFCIGGLATFSQSNDETSVLS